MASQPYNLDQDVQESFKFIFGGVTYIFKHLNTEQMDELLKFRQDPNKFIDYVIQFITPEDPKALPFKEARMKMLAPHMKNFNKMLIAELGVE